MRILIFLTACAFFAASAWSCPSPANIEGVAFTSGETLNLDALIAMGNDGVNYLIEGEGEQKAVRYASSYDSRAMVFVGTYGLSYQAGTSLPCMGVILDPSLYTDIYQACDKADFDFCEAVKAELGWLADAGVVDISEETIDEIHAALKSAANGGVQYWTLQQKALGYNSWYSYDEQQGVWQTDGADGVFGGSAVRSAQGTEGCSAVSPTFALPAQALSSGNDALFRAPGSARADIQSIVLHDSRLVVRLANPSAVHSSGKLRALNGAVVAGFSIAEDSREAAVETTFGKNLSSAMYIVEIGDVRRAVWLPFSSMR